MPLSNQDLQARLGKLTASRMRIALGKLKNGESSAERKKLMIDLVAERITGVFVSHYVTDAMQHGIDTEPLAIISYMARTGSDVIDGHYLDHPSIDNFGATPDGFIDGGGLLECKCPTTSTFIMWMSASVIPEDHKPQMAAQLLCTGRSWVDFHAHDPRMPKGMRDFTRRFTPDMGYLTKIREAAEEFLSETEELFRRVTES